MSCSVAAAPCRFHELLVEFLAELKREPQVAMNLQRQWHYDGENCQRRPHSHPRSPNCVHEQESYVSPTSTNLRRPDDIMKDVKLLRKPLLTCAICGYSTRSSKSHLHQHLVAHETAAGGATSCNVNVKYGSKKAGTCKNRKRSSTSSSSSIEMTSSEPGAALQASNSQSDMSLVSEDHMVLVPNGSTGGWPRKPARPFVCSVCKKTYTIQRHLDLHKNIHAAVNPISCRFCNFLFSSSIIRRYHEKVCPGNRNAVVMVAPGSGCNQRINIDDLELD